MTGGVAALASGGEGTGDDCPSYPCRDVVMAVRVMTVGMMVVGVRSLWE